MSRLKVISITFIPAIFVSITSHRAHLTKVSTSEMTPLMTMRMMVHHKKIATIRRPSRQPVRIYRLVFGINDLELQVMRGTTGGIIELLLPTPWITV